MRIVLVCGARPNFMKIAPLMRAIAKNNASPNSISIDPFLVHTGQHYDYAMSQVFFNNLELSDPDIHLDIGSGTHAEQTGKVMIEFEKILYQKKPDLVVVVGDVNSTLAAAMVAAKLCIPVAHVEAGLRSFDRTMPEEINRLLTDVISDYLFTPSPDADDNLKKEGIPEKKIHLVGNVMVDSLLHNTVKADESAILSNLGVVKGEYAILTLHRPSNVDGKLSLHSIGTALKEICQSIPIVFPAHPRTRKNIDRFELSKLFQDKRIILSEPLGYLDFLKLMKDCKFALTDSGGVQEETTVLGIPCLTLRDTTERPITLTQGTNTLVYNDTQMIVNESFKIIDGKGRKGDCPKLWDGKAAERIISILARDYKG